MPLLATLAELIEVFSALQAKGWNCASTNGEALSRVLAMRQYPYMAFGYVTSATWLDSTRPDYITANKAGSGADADDISNGCGVLFLNWLAYELGYSWRSIVQAGATSLAQTYTNLTGRTDGASRFFTVMQTRFPVGQPSQLKVDNPFPLLGMRLMYLHQDGSPMFLLRHYDGNWSATPLLTKPGAHFSAIGCTAVTHRLSRLTEFHHCGISNTTLLHQVVLPSDSIIADAPISFPHALTSLSCTSDTPGNLVVALSDSSGGAMLMTRWEPDRYDDIATWSGPIDVKSSAGNPGSVSAISCASPADNELHVCAVTSDGNLWHTIRHPNGAWDAFGYVKGQTGNPGPIHAVACASPNPGEVHICVITSDGRFWHTIRHPNGAWDLFNTRSGFPSPAIAVGCTRTSLAGELQVCIVGQDGSLWHAIRHPNGAWDPFGWVEGQVPDATPATAVACAQASLW
ncbi:hypothetical protein KDH_27250 [Dictyobacter sp. S3.2.2.5]|uniref:Uncharacterized protein n=1 Tax=Dictyobacter halimunensis TaxID=3026934 RepID=A0ABQ6FSU9_9CHLR|nr:hypothetical protein KDH_27250 [Dictyobacter sp. S3.2.2.5]